MACRSVTDFSIGWVTLGAAITWNVLQCNAMYSDSLTASTPERMSSKTKKKWVAPLFLCFIVQWSNICADTDLLGNHVQYMPWHILLFWGSFFSQMFYYYYLFYLFHCCTVQNIIIVSGGWKNLTAEGSGAGMLWCLRSG